MIDKRLKELKKQYQNLVPMTQRTTDLLELLAHADRVCEWTFQDRRYYPACSGIVYDKRAVYCPYCGGKIKEVGGE